MSVSRRPLYNIWKGIKRRCLNPDDPGWKWYGGRGISLHPAWADDFAAFEAGVIRAIGERPSRLHSIDRINPDGDYTPENIRWATSLEQNANRRDNRWVTYQGRRRLSSHWAREFGLTPGTFDNRLRGGWDIERALTTPPRPIRTKKRVRALQVVTT